MKFIDRFCLPITAVIVAVVILAAVVFAAQDRGIPSPDRVSSLTIAPSIDLNGTLVSFLLTAKFVSVDARPSGTVEATEIGSIQIDLAKSNGVTVLDGVAVDDREAADQLLAIAARESSIPESDGRFGTLDARRSNPMFTRSRNRDVLHDGGQRRPAHHKSVFVLSGCAVFQFLSKQFVNHSTSLSLGESHRFVIR